MPSASSLLMIPSRLRSFPSSHPSPGTPCSSNLAYSLRIRAAVGSKSAAEVDLWKEPDAMRCLGELGNEDGAGVAGKDELDVTPDTPEVEPVEARG